MTDMTDPDVHTVPRDGAWVNEVRGHVVGGSFATLEDAVSAGQDEAGRRGVEHHVDDRSAVAGTSAKGGLTTLPDDERSRVESPGLEQPDPAE